MNNPLERLMRGSGFEPGPSAAILIVSHIDAGYSLVPAHSLVKMGSTVISKT